MRLPRFVAFADRGPGRWHSADICFVPEDVPAVDGMGPAGTGERTQDEYILRSSLVERAALLAMTMHRCAKGEEA